MRFLYPSLLMLLLGLSSSVFADEVSLLSGFYRSQENQPGIKSQNISLGGRYGFGVAADKHFWFLDVGVGSTSYSGDNAPDGGSSLRLGAGQKYFFRNFGKAIHTFLSWSAGYAAEKGIDGNPNTESSGIYYAGDAGLRFDWTKTIFVDMEAQVFNSSLMRTVKTRDPATGNTAETKITELQVDTFGGADSLRFGVGMVF